MTVLWEGMYKILIDMGVEIPEDEVYMQLYKLRHKQIFEWYQNIIDNLCYVVCNIENPNNVKKYKLNKRQEPWEYTNEELINIFENYNLQIDKNELFKKINIVRKSLAKGN